MKKIIMFALILLFSINVSFANDFFIKDNEKFVSCHKAKEIWGTEIKYYPESKMVKLDINADSYYMRVDTDIVKKNIYINPFFINSSKLRFNDGEKLNSNVVLVDDVIYIPISFFYKNLYEENLYDVIVIGGEPEGVTSAVSAARNGGKTLLLSEQDGLGGLFTYGMLNSLDMNYNKEGELLTKGIFDEFYDRIGRKDSFDVKEVKQVFENMILYETNIDYRPNYTLEDVIMEDDRIIGVIMKDIEGELHEFYGKRIIDATPDADVCVASGTPYYDGMKDINIDQKMACTLVFQVGGVKWEELAEDIRNYQALTNDTVCGVTNYSAWGFAKWCYDNYVPINDNMRLRGPNFGLQQDGSILINGLQIFGVDAEDEESIKRAKSDGREEVYNIMKHLREKLNSFDDAYLMGVADELYIRETRHIQGEYILKATDLLNGTNFADKIALGSYPVDIQSTDVSNYGYVLFAPDQYAIPYRCTVPLKIENLFVVGKAASYSSVAAGSARVVPIGMVVGESIGAIAMYSISNEVSPREITYNNEMLVEIHDILVDQGVYLPDIVSSTNIENILGYEKINKIIDMGLAIGGYDNNFKFEEIVSCASACNNFINSLKRSGYALTDENISKIMKFYSLEYKADAITIAKIISIINNEELDYTFDEEIWDKISREGYFDDTEIFLMNDEIKTKDLYIIISNLLSELEITTFD